MAEVALRGEELRALTRELQRPGIVTVTGRGGMGKTWLARRVAADRGVWVSCISATELDDLVRNVAEVAGVPTRGAIERDLALAAKALRAKTDLVVLDNLEQVVESARPVVTVLADAGLRVLGTSRVPLEVPDERVLPLEPAPVVPLVDLFLRRADPATVDGVSDRADIERVIVAVGRNPLAVEIAAGHTALSTPRQLAEQLERDLRLDDLDGRHRPAHASLHAVVEATWSLLSPEARQGLLLVCAFAETFRTEDARALGVAPAALAELLRWSFLSREVGAEVQLRVPVEVRATVWAHRPPDLADLERHARFVVEQAHRWQAHVAQVDHRRAMEHLSRWFPDLRAVLERPRLPSDLRAVALYAAARYLGARHTGQCVALLEQHTCVPEDPDRQLSLRLLHAQVLRRARRVQEADAVFEHAEALADTPVRRARVTSERAYRLLQTADRVTPVELGRRAVADAEEAGDDAVLADALFVLGVILRARTEDVDVAISVLERARGVAAAAGARSTEIQALCNLILLSAARGPERTASAYQQARELARSMGDEAFEGLVDEHYASQLLWHGKAEEAQPIVAAAVEVLERMGHEASALYSLTSLQILFARHRPTAEVRAELLALQERARARGRSGLDGELVAALGVCDHRERDYDSARAKYLEADALLEASGRSLFARPRHLVALVDAEQGLPASSDDPVVAAAIEVWSGGPGEALVEALERTQRGGPMRHLRDAVARRALTESTPWTIQQDGRAFRTGAGEVVQLGRRRAPRRILVALLDARTSKPGEILDADALIEVGWPGERIVPHAAKNRLWAAIKDLRQLGLGELLQTVDEGYRLDPTVSVESTERV